MNSRIKRLEEQISTLSTLKAENDKKIEEFLEDEKVRQFLNLYQDTQMIKKTLEEKQKQYVQCKMESCEHVYVATEVVNQEDGTKSKVYHCLRCGLTNEYAVKDMSDLVAYPFSEMEDLYAETYINAYILESEVIEIPFLEYAKIFEVAEKENPDLSLPELKEIIQREVMALKPLLLKNTKRGN